MLSAGESITLTIYFLDVLIQDSLLEQQQGCGTFIISKNLKHDNNYLNSSTKASEFKTMRAPQAIASQSNITSNDKTYYLNQLHDADKHFYPSSQPEY
ncbi:GntR family transcriptional regulator [Yersinia aldovae]|uniref:hypothetical protein n=1 Tax=Yersinia aldovae TaxID=29483 RepID=UPI0005AC8C0B|nr:hypothetical protein [Yersinia aldovae]